MLKILFNLLNKLTPTGWLIVLSIIAVGVSIAISRSNFTELTGEWLSASQKDHQQIISTTDRIEGKTDEITEILNGISNLENENTGWYRLVKSREKDRYGYGYSIQTVIIDPTVIAQDSPILIPSNHFEVLIVEAYYTFKLLMQYSRDEEKYTKYASQISALNDNFGIFAKEFVSDSGKEK